MKLFNVVDNWVCDILRLWVLDDFVGSDGEEFVDDSIFLRISEDDECILFVWKIFFELGCFELGGNFINNDDEIVF